ncbi:acyltransferase family protein [Mammaliicoccus lentus]|uniref:acyltransferase family protein n=1 Tax=Mammaliicoccus lentus TaxID=42858 RepID=UPI003A599B3A
MQKHITYLDNIKLFFALLVITHHSLMSYVVSGEVNESINGISSLLVSFNQAFFMGGFFLISGLFVENSYNRKGSQLFLKKRFKKLVLPIIFYFIILSQIQPISEYFIFNKTYDINVFFKSMNIGPLWFIAMLFIFNLGYVLIKKYTNFKMPILKLNIISFIILYALVLYVWRVFMPLIGGEPLISTVIYDWLLKFTPSIGDLPQYLIAFMLGIVAFKFNLLEKIKNTKWKLSIFYILLSLPIYLAAVIIGISDFSFSGGLSLASILYSFWEALFGVSIMLVIFKLFYKYFNKENAFIKTLSKCSFTMYIIHLPIISVIENIIKKYHLIGSYYALSAIFVTIVITILISLLVLLIKNLAVEKLRLKSNI